MPNSNPTQSWLLIFNTVLTAIVTFLMSQGCITAADGALTCSAAHTYTWLAPYLVYIALAVNIVKTGLGFITGKMFTPTVVVSKFGDTGTVTKDQIN